MIDIVDAMTTEQIPFYFANKINESVFDFLSLEVFPKEITKSIFFCVTIESQSSKDIKIGREFTWEN